MKIIVLSGAILLSQFVSAQEKVVLEPQYVGIPYVISEAGALIPLEKQPVRQAIRAKKLGIRGGTLSIWFEGEKSSASFPAGTPLSFVVRIPDRDKNHNDPGDQISVNLLTLNKGNREYLMAKARAFGSNEQLTTDPGSPTLRFVPVGTNSIQFSPTQALPPEEYLLTTKFSPAGFLFGIDTR